MNLADIKTTKDGREVSDLFQSNKNCIAGYVKVEGGYNLKKWFSDGRSRNNMESPDDLLIPSDAIKPNHYPNAGKNDVITFCQDNGIGFVEGNVIKYVVRHKNKNGVEDLKKAQEYLKRLIDSYEQGS